MLKWFYIQIIYTGFQHDYIVVQNCGGLAEIRGPYLHLRMAINEVKKLAENCGNDWNKSNFIYLTDQYEQSESDYRFEIGKYLFNKKMRNFLLIIFGLHSRPMPLFKK